MKNSKLNYIIFILSVILIIGIAVFAYVKNQNINTKNSNHSDVDNKGTKISSVYENEYDVNEDPVFCVSDGYIVKATKNGLKWIDKGGKEVNSLMLPLESPIMKSVDSNILVVNKNGRDVYVIEKQKIKWQKTLNNETLMENSIINADINKNGYVTVIQKAKRHKGAVTLFDRDGNEIFTKGKGDSYVLSSFVSNDQKQIMINTYDTSGISIDSLIEFINIDNIESNKGNPYAIITEGDSLFSFVRFLKNNEVITAGEKFIRCYDNNRKMRWQVTPKKVYSVDCSYEKFAVAAVKGQPKDSKIRKVVTDINTYNTDGTLRSTYSINNGVINIKAFDSVIAVNTGRQVIFTDIGGGLIGKYSSKMDVIQVHFLDRKTAVVITKRTTDIVNL